MLGMGSPIFLLVLAHFVRMTGMGNRGKRRGLGGSQSQDGLSQSGELLPQARSTEKSPMRRRTDMGPDVGPRPSLIWGELTPSGGHDWGRVSRNVHILLKIIICKCCTLGFRALHPHSSPEGLRETPAGKPQT